MRRMKLVGLALAAVLALSAFVASAALAQPKFELAGGGSAVGTTFTVAGEAGEMITGAASEPKVNCSASTSGGTINAASTVSGVTVTFTGCAATGKGHSCTVNSAGETVGGGTIKTNELEGELVTTSIGEKVGEVLKPVAAANKIYVEIEMQEIGGGGKCAATMSGPVKGSIVGEVLPVEKTASTAGELIYKKTAESGSGINEQEIHEYFEPANETKKVTGQELKAFGLIKSALKQKNNVTFSAAVKVHR